MVEVFTHLKKLHPKYGITKNNRIILARKGPSGILRLDVKGRVFYNNMLCGTLDDYDNTLPEWRNEGTGTAMIINAMATLITNLRCHSNYEIYPQNFLPSFYVKQNDYLKGH